MHDGEPQQPAPLPSPAQPVPDRDSGRSQPLTSIIILTCNQLAYTRQCIAGITRHTPEPHEIIFIDNGSTDGTVAWLETVVASNPRYRLIANGKNLGFAAGCNQGLRKATGQYLLLLNNDVVVTPGWLSGMLACFSEAPDVGIVGPMTNAASGAQLLSAIRYDSLDDLDDFANSFHLRQEHLRVPSPRIVGFCMIFSRELMDRIGFLDEQFGSGNFEDDDYCYRAALEGYRNVIAADVFVHHFGSVSFQGNNIDYDAALRRNREIYSRKWHGSIRDMDTARKILVAQTLEKAAELVQSWDLDGAVSVLLDEGIRFLPEDRRLYEALAGHLIDAGRYRDTLDVLESLPATLDGARGRVMAGQAKLGMGEIAEAKHLAEQALEIAPEHGGALTLLGAVAMAEQDAAKAARYCTSAISAAPSLGAPYTLLGKLAQEAGSEEEALELLEKGFQLSPTAPSAVDPYHRLITERGLFSRGIAALRGALHFHGGSRSLRYLLIDLLCKSGEIANALVEIEEAIVRYGADDGIVSAALELRDRIGPCTVETGGKEEGITISLCMIVRDEARHLPRCLSSLAPLADEMIVVDTGSTDRSADIARVFGARVYDFAWTGDFSAARNHAIDRAGGDWILVMDADEAIAAQDHAAVRRLCGSGKSRAYALVTRNYTRQIDQEKWQPNSGEYPGLEAGAGWTPSNKVRLFPNVAGVGFVNPVHELVEPSLEKFGVHVMDAPVPVHHYGCLDEAGLRRKAETYYRIGREKLAADPGNLKAIIELAVQCGETERHDEAIELWRQALAISPALPLAYFNRGYNYLQTGRLDEARRATEQALSLQPDYPEAAANLAYCELCAGNPEKGARIAQAALRQGKESPKLHLLLGAALCCCGVPPAGLEQFELLVRQRIDFLPFVTELTRKLISRQNIDCATRLVDAVIAGGYGNEELERLRKEIT